MLPSFEGIDVTDRASFITFLKSLQQDLQANESAWENPTLDRFLEAMAAYANDLPGFYRNTGQNVEVDEVSWKVFSDILLGARLIRIGNLLSTDRH